MAIQLSNVSDQPGSGAYFTLYDDAASHMERTRMSFEYASRQDADAGHKSMAAALAKATVTVPAAMPR